MLARNEEVIAIIWDAAKQQQLDELRARAEHSTLPSDEQRTLNQLLAELGQQEWSVLRPALDCTACYRLKGDIWPATEPLTTTRRLLHPKRDNLIEQLREEPDGRMVALTATGAFHLDR
jgi:hypothetical protein